MSQLQAAIVPVTPFQQNCTLLWDDDTKAGVIVDPGGDLAQIEAAIAKTGLLAEAILLTHGHIDHAGGAAQLREALGVEVIGPHLADKFLLDSLPETGRGYGMPEARSVVPDRWLEEGDVVAAAGLSFEIFHCPGHSPGSVIYVARALKLVLMGDVLFRGSVGRTDLRGGDHATLMASIRDKILPLGDEMAFICGHGPMSSIGDERRSNPFLQDLDARSEP